MRTYLTNYCVYYNIYIYDKRMYNSETILLRYNMLNNILHLRVKRIFKTRKYYNYDFPGNICIYNRTHNTVCISYVMCIVDEERYVRLVNRIFN